ncbi:MAG: hypothetical protein GX556_16040 [Fibrobacter sp.]|nr:hypothetical protein [Fibrobacter sp.]
MDCNLKIVQVPADRPAGWDVGDFILDGADFQTVFKFIRDNLTDLPENLPEPPEKRQEPAERKPTPEQAEAAMAPFRPLGVYGDSIVIYPFALKTAVFIKGSNCNKNTLLTIAPLRYWERMYESRRGADFTSAADHVLRACEREGHFDVSRIRRRGAHEDDGRYIIHTGDSIYENGKYYNLHEFQSRFIYEAAPGIGNVDYPPLNTLDANKIRTICQMLHWQNPIHALYLAGWIVLAPICGALPWRPHIWITGPRGCGKSYVDCEIIKRILGPSVLFVQGNTTEAGIRQALNGDVIAILFDESEGDSPNGIKRIQLVLELMRQSSSDSSGVIIKGSKNGKPDLYPTKSAYCLSSICVNLQNEADISRVAVLTLRTPHELSALEKRAHFEKLDNLVQSTLTADFCARFRARSYKLLPVIIQNFKTFSKVAAEKFGSQRLGDMAGSLLAGAYSLSSSNIVTEKFAQDWIEEQDWGSDDFRGEGDERACLRTILEAKLRVRNLEFSIAQLLLEAKPRYDHEKYEPTIERGESLRVLRQNGITIQGDPSTGLYIVFSEGHSQLKQILRNTAWGISFYRLLKRLPDAVEKGSCRFNGVVSRAVSLPWKAVICDE